MISTVAVGTDGSGTAGEAVKQAAEFARRFDAKLVLLSAFKDDPPPTGTDEAEWAYNPAAQLREILSRTEAELNEQGIECSTVVDEGDPADVLVRLADECDADVLVIGNKGMQRRVLGSVPKSVAHNAGCSVFVVKTT
ncbi:MAG TPA: universal stress protein [Solirubrobacterales bacterium]|nr:universal stress protein [Solirubrobacterales bacterium]